MDDSPSLNKKILIWATPVLTLLAANLIVFHEYWTAERLFSGKDLLTAFGPLLNFQTDCLQEWSLPLWNPFMNFGYPFAEHYSNTMFFPTHLLMGLVTGSTMELIQRELLFWIFLGGLGVYACAREFGRSKTASVVAGLSYMFCGQVVALPQWHLLVYNAACFPYLLLGYHRAKRTDGSLSLIAILFLAFSLLGGHITTTVLGVYFFAGYVMVDSLLSRRVAFGLRFLTVTVVAAALLSLPKLAPMFESIRSGPRMSAPASMYTKDPFNVINSYHFMSLVLPVKYFFSLYIGQFIVLGAAFAAFRKRLRLDALLVLCIISAWLLMVDNEGNVSLLRSAANFLPFMKLVRNEWFEWFYPSLFAILFLSDKVDRFLAEPLGRSHVAAAIIFSAVMAAVYLLAYDTMLYAMPFAAHIALAGLLLALPLLRNRKHLQFAAAAVVVTLDFFLVFSFVAPDEPPLLGESRMRIAVIDQGSIAKTFRDDNRVHPNFSATAVRDRLRPPVSESVKWPVLQSGLHGAPFINYSPEQYGMFIDDMNLKRFSGWWYNAQERFDFIRLKESPLLAQMEGQPLFTLFDRRTAAAAGSASFDSVSCSRFGFTVQGDGPGFLLVNQMYDARWEATVDGVWQPVAQANDFFMGVEVPPGRHKVSLVFRDHLFNAGLLIGAVTFVGLVAAGLYGRLSRKDRHGGAKMPGLETNAANTSDA